jgi:hypothetical protein
MYKEVKMRDIPVNEAKVLGRNFTNDPVSITSSLTTKAGRTVAKITLVNEEGARFDFEASVPSFAIESIENIGHHNGVDIIIDQVCPSKYGIALRIGGRGMVRLLLRTEYQFVGQEAKITFSHYTKRELHAVAA